MKKRFLAGMIASAALAMFAVPSLGHAGLVDHMVEADCVGTTNAAGTGTCTATFDFEATGFVSNIDTHGNFHDVLVAPPGTVSLEWKDAQGNTVYTADCVAPGVYVDPVGTGPFDVQSATCTSTYKTAEAFQGIQTLTVTASGAANEPFHGHIAISADDSSI